MPILVQWKWQNRTKSFLVIFHFYDDFSKSNLRFKMERIVDKSVVSVQSGVDFRSAIRRFVHPSSIEAFDKSITKPIMTWAPSHVELGYLGEVLRYANIIDGLNESEKNGLRPLLAAESESHLLTDPYDHLRLRVALSDKRELFCIEKENEEINFAFRGIELCSEYIDYLGEILKPYMS